MRGFGPFDVPDLHPLEVRVVIVVGAGVMGLTAAVTLARRGHRVRVLEAAPDLCGGCSDLGGGMLAPLSELDHAEPAIARAGLDAPERWKALLGEASEGVLECRGSLLVAHRPEWPLLAQVEDRARRAGLHDRLQVLTGPALREHEPLLGDRFARGLYLPSEGVVYPRRLLPRLVRLLVRAGGEISLSTPVVRVEPGAVHTADGTFEGTVVDARGLGARERLPLRGVRGERVVLRVPGASLRRPVRVMHPRYPLYAVPRPDGLLYLGATQVESEHTGGVVARAMLELLSAAWGLDPALAEAEVVEQGVGLRPALNDNHPTVRVQAGLIEVNGLFRHGFLLAPLLAEGVADAVEGARELPFSEVACAS